MALGFFRPKPADMPAPKDATATVVKINVFDEALDTVAAMLRSTGKYPILDDEYDQQALAGECEEWAIHALVGAPPPGSDPDSAPASNREWQRLRYFFSSLREREHLLVSGMHKSAEELRQVILGFYENVTDVFKKEQTSDTQLQEQLSAIRGALSSNSIDDLRQQVRSAVEVISQITQQRRDEQLAQLNDMGGRLNQLNEELQAAKRAGQRDALTQLYNRASFDDRLTRTASLRRLYDNPACLLMIDLDNFKWVNDKYGHHAGDTVLKALSILMSDVFGRKTDFVARFGGDEFAVILGETVADDACRMASKLIKLAREIQIECEGKPIRVTVSVGIAEIARNEAPDSWFERADKALYSAKRAGRDRFVILEG